MNRRCRLPAQGNRHEEDYLALNKIPKKRPNQLSDLEILYRIIFESLVGRVLFFVVPALRAHKILLVIVHWFSVEVAMSEPPLTAFPPSRFAQISTHRDLLGNADALLERYSRAIRSFLFTVLRDEDSVQDVLLALRIKILDGRFARWTPGQGRFRSYLKQAVLNEALQHLRKQRNRRREQQVEDLTRFPEGRSGGEAADVWLNLYRSAVLEAALKSLRNYQDQHPGNVFHTLLTLLSGGPCDASGAAQRDLSDAELAAQLSRSTGRNYTVANFAQQKRRARQKFAELLATEVRLTLEQPTPEDLADELRHLGLLGYIGDFLPPDSRAESDRAEPDD